MKTLGVKSFTKVINDLLWINSDLAVGKKRHDILSDWCILRGNTKKLNCKSDSYNQILKVSLRVSEQ